MFDYHLYSLMAIKRGHNNIDTSENLGEYIRLEKIFRISLLLLHFSSCGLLQYLFS